MTTVDIILVLLALLLFEAAVLAGMRIGRALHGERRGQGEKGPESAESADYERRWQEGIDAMLGYDVRKARSAAGRDLDER